MIEIPRNFSKMSWLQLLVVCLKILIYFDTSDISELNNQVGGADGEENSENVENDPAVIEANGENGENGGITTNGAENVENDPANGAAAAANGIAVAANSATALAPGTNKSSALKYIASNITNANKMVAKAAEEAKKGGIEQDLNADLSGEKDLENIKTGGMNNNAFASIIKSVMGLVKKIAKAVGSLIGELFGKFIFAATFPALPFFLIMGAMYSFVKYGAFKLREV